MKYLKFAILLSFLISSSCEYCEDKTEPTAFLYIMNDIFYDSIFEISRPDSIINNYSLPLSINSDSVIYILKSGNIQDTLGIKYNRNIYYYSDDCGMAIEIDNFELLNVSTFDSAVFVIQDTSYNMFGYNLKNEYWIEVYH